MSEETQENDGLEDVPGAAAFSSPHVACEYALDVYRQGRPDEALARCRKIVAEVPGMAPAHRLAARILTERGAAKAALVHLEALRSLLPEDLEVLAEYARVLEETGDPRQARRQALQFLRLAAPGHPLQPAVEELEQRCARDLGLRPETAPPAPSSRRQPPAAPRPEAPSTSELEALPTFDLPAPLLPAPEVSTRRFALVPAADQEEAFNEWWLRAGEWRENPPATEPKSPPPLCVPRRYLEPAGGEAAVEEAARKRLVLENAVAREFKAAAGWRLILLLDVFVAAASGSLGAETARRAGFFQPLALSRDGAFASRELAAILYAKSLDSRPGTPPTELAGNFPLSPPVKAEELDHWSPALAEFARKTAGPWMAEIEAELKEEWLAFAQHQREELSRAQRRRKTLALRAQQLAAEWERRLHADAAARAVTLGVSLLGAAEFCLPVVHVSARVLRKKDERHFVLVYQPELSDFETPRCESCGQASWRLYFAEGSMRTGCPACWA